MTNRIVGLFFASILLNQSCAYAFDLPKGMYIKYHDAGNKEYTRLESGVQSCSPLQGKGLEKYIANKAAKDLGKPIKTGKTTYRPILEVTQPFELTAGDVLLVEHDGPIRIINMPHDPGTDKDIAFVHSNPVSAHVFPEKEMIYAGGTKVKYVHGMLAKHGFRARPVNTSTTLPFNPSGKLIKVNKKPSTGGEIKLKNHIGTMNFTVDGLNMFDSESRKLKLGVNCISIVLFGKRTNKPNL